MERNFKIFQNTFCLTAESFIKQEPTSYFGSMDSGYSVYSVPENSLETMHIIQTLFALRVPTKEMANRGLIVKQLIKSELLHSLDQDSFCKPEKLV